MNINFNLITRWIKNASCIFHSSRIGPRGKCVQAFSIISPSKKNYSCKILRSQGSDGERRDRRRSMTPTGTLEALIFVRDSSDRISSIPSISSTPSLSPVPVSSSCSSRFYSKFRVLSHPPIERMKLEAKKKEEKRRGEVKLFRTRNRGFLE